MWLLLLLQVVFSLLVQSDFKAKFSISVEKPRGFTALSNMPPVQDVSVDKAGFVKFQTTPKMSTYLVALIVCDFGQKASQTKAGTLGSSGNVSL